MIYLAGFLAIMAILFLPQIWVRRVMARHAGERSDFPGTGGELARHLLDEAGLGHVTVEVAPQGVGDHYDPRSKTIRLTPENHDGRSVTAVAVAAHETGHAFQDAGGYTPLALRTRMAGTAQKVQAVGSVVLMAAPLVALLTRSPSAMLVEIGAGVAILATGVVVHLVTLPVEWDASFARALPMLERGGYLARADMASARKVLTAAALTYVAAALRSMLDVVRWLRVLRF